MPKAIKGTRDILPIEIPKWHAVEQAARDVFALYGFEEIRTPVFEETELFVRGIGESTDNVEKEMYTFRDKSEHSITLRPEMTAPVVRAYIDDIFTCFHKFRDYIHGKGMRQSKENNI